MRTPSYCFKSLGKVFYWRMRIPKELQPILKKTEFKKSLRTKDKTIALRLCRQYIATAEQTFASLRLQLFQSELVGNNGNDPFGQISLFDGIDTPVANQTEEPPPRESDNELPLSKLIEIYINEVTSKRGRDISRGIEKNLMRFMEVVGDKPVTQYTIEDRQKYREVLQRIPKRINGPRYKDQSITDILKLNHPEEKRLSVTSVNHRLTDTATFLNWCVKNNLIESHPFKNAVIKKKTSLDKERPALTDTEIKKILENLPINRPSLYWCILISCFTALRQSEVASLDSSDVTCQDGLFCLNINDRGDKRLKNKNARRVIPLHPILLKAGIINLAQSQAGNKLFSDIKPYKGKYGHQVSKDFAKYRKSISIHGAGQTFHGIRHSVISKLWSAGIPEAHTAAIAGHQRGERESYIRYAKKNDLKPLQIAINAIDYGSVQIPPWPHRMDG
jgi:integrase